MFILYMKVSGDKTVEKYLTPFATWLPRPTFHLHCAIYHIERAGLGGFWRWRPFKLLVIQENGFFWAFDYRSTFYNSVTSLSTRPWCALINPRFLSGPHDVLGHHGFGWQLLLCFPRHWQMIFVVKKSELALGGKVVPGRRRWFSLL